MPEERERPRPHGDPLEPVIERNPEEIREQTPSDRARERGSDANGIPEFDDAAGTQRTRQYDEGADLVSGID